MDWSPYHGTIGIVTGLHSYETATVFIPSWGDKHLDCEVLEVISEAGGSGQGHEDGAYSLRH